MRRPKNGRLFVCLSKSLGFPICVQDDKIVIRCNEYRCDESNYSDCQSLGSQEGRTYLNHSRPAGHRNLRLQKGTARTRMSALHKHMSLRPVKQIITPKPTIEGAGV